MSRTCETIWKTRQDKTRRTKHDTRHLSNRRDPRLGCSKGFGRVIYGRQDKIAQPQRSQPRMQQMLRKSQTVEDKARQDKTRQTKHDTLHLAQPQRSPPRMHRRLQKSTTMEGKTRQQEQDYERQDKDKISASLRNRNALGYCTRACAERPCPTFCASPRRRNARGHVTRATSYGNLQGKMPEPKTTTQTLCEPAQSKCTWKFHKSHFTQKFTGKMPEPKTGTHTVCKPALDNSQEPLYTEIYRKKCPSPELGRRLCVSLRRRDAHGHVTIATSYRNLAKKCPSSEPRRKLCASLHNRNALGKSHFLRKCAGKMPEPGHILCASLRDRNALGDFTRAILYRNLLVKGRRPAGAP